jgi:hypothetical protein
MPLIVPKSDKNDDAAEMMEETKDTSNLSGCTVLK